MPETTREQLDELARLEAESTPGPWECGVYDIHLEGDRSRAGRVGSCVKTPDGDLISAARNALPALIADAGVLHDMADEGDARAKLAALRADLILVSTTGDTTGPCAVFAGHLLEKHA